MRTALVLLFAIAAASILGSLFPQQGISPEAVARYVAAHPGIGPMLDRLGMFDVFGSAWFTAIYLALLTALVACLVPRVSSFARVVRSRPPRARARLDRYRNLATLDTSLPPEQAMAAARRVLRRRRFRVAAHGGGQLAAEKGYLREAGSLVFHVSFLLLLVGLAYGKGWGYRGQLTLIEGETRTNTRVNYDAFTPGRWYGPEQLPQFSLHLDDFSNSFWPSGQPREFASRLTSVDAGGRVQRQKVTVNRPMTVDGVRVFQSDYGYAPVVKVTVKGPRGKLITPQDGPLLTLRTPAETSNGAIKLPMLDPQVGLDVTMFTGFRVEPGPGGAAQIGNDPRLVNPLLVVFPSAGDLHADRAQSVFTLDHTDLRPLADRPLLLPLGGTGKLPGGLGTVSFTGVRQYTVLTLARDPGVPVVLAAAVLVLLGLLPSLYVTRRRVWARSTATDQGARVELAGLALQGKAAFADEFAELAAELGRQLDRSPRSGGGDTLDGVAEDAEAPAGSPSG
jgi:cytochrome c biogenesis protein